MPATDMLLDPAGRCPGCQRIWKVATEPTKVVRVVKGRELRGYQCPWCDGIWTPTGTMVWAPHPEVER